MKKRFRATSWISSRRGWRGKHPAEGPDCRHGDHRPRFKAGEVFIPEVLLAARAMKRGVEDPGNPPVRGSEEKGGENRARHGQRRPPRHRQEPGGHDAPGRRLRGGDLGINVPAEEFVKQVAESETGYPGIVGPPHHHHAGDEKSHSGPGKGRPAQEREGHGRGSPGSINDSRRRSAPTAMAMMPPRRWIWQKGHEKSHNA